jgi:hypothetical protein
MKPALHRLLWTLVIIALPLPAVSQSLAEVARKERERRQQIRDARDRGETNPSPQAPRPNSTPPPRPAMPATATVKASAPPTAVAKAPARTATPPPSTVEPAAPVLMNASADLPVVVIDERGASIQEVREPFDRFDRGTKQAIGPRIPDEPRQFQDRLGVAQSYAQSGNYGAARAEYRAILDEDADNVDAMVGVAQTYHWAVAGEIAREWYENALKVEPESTAAQLGLGYVELWSEPSAAEKRADRVEQYLPGSDEVERLRQESERMRAPEVMFSYDQLDDTNGNLIDTAWLETGFGLGRGTQVRIGAARYGMDFGGDPLLGAPGTGSIESMYGVVSMRVAAGQRVNLRLGVDRTNNTLGTTDYVPIGGGSWDFGLGRRWSGSVGFDQDTFRYTTLALDEGIILKALSGSVTGRLTENWFWDGAVGYWDTDDALERQNSRFDVETGIRYRTQLGRNLPIEAGYAFRHFGFEENFGASFFSPASYVSHRAHVRASGDFGSFADFLLQFDTGIQSYDQVRNEPLLGGMGMLGIKLGSGYRLELFGVRGDYLLLSDFAVTTEQFGIRVRWKGGAAR